MKTLVVYYSYSGITRKLAEDIALLTDGELRELKPQKPYSYSYNTAVKEVRGEIKRGYCPPLQEGAEPVGDAELIFIGSPNWLHTFAPPVLSFLREVNLSGKTVIPFCTHGGGGFGDMPERYRKECKGAVLRDGIALKGDYSFDVLEAWIRKNMSRQPNAETLAALAEYPSMQKNRGAYKRYHSFDEVSDECSSEK